jgi:predicted nucleotidyltransferase
MADINRQLLEMIAAVARALGPDLCARTAFVGGVTTGLLVTDEIAREGVRVTDDVDLIVDIVSYGKWVQFQEELRKKGFRESPDDDFVCRMRLGPLKVDFMPDDETVLGFTNRWYELGLKTADSILVDDGLAIRILTPPLFIATKLEAYLGRGGGDVLMSRDIEDILILIDGRDTLVSEIAEAPGDLRRYIAEQFESLCKDDQFESAVAGNLRGDKGRIELTFNRLSDSIAQGRRP